MKLSEYCKCGGQMTGSIAPDSAAIEAKRIFWKFHSGEGHGSVERSVCYRARRKQESEQGVK